MKKKFSTIKKAIIIHLLMLIVLLIIFFIATYWLNYKEAFRLVFGLFYVLFLPGYVLTYVFFKNKKINWITRITFSLGLSIAVVPMSVFYLNLLGVEITDLNVALIIGLIIIFSSIWVGVEDYTVSGIKRIF